MPTLLTTPWHRPPHPPGHLQLPEKVIHYNDQYPAPSQPFSSSFVYVISHHIFLYFTVVLFSLLLKIRTRLLQAETAKHNAELFYLKAQINPHFLFNTLNSIYSLALVKDDRTADAVIQLSEMMRYIIKDTGNDLVSLEKEINYINNYIALQKSRFGDTVSIVYQAEGNFSTYQIASLLLITYIENAFKHGVNPDQKSEIRISIQLKEHDLHLVVFNRKVNTGYDENGIGLKNANERLELLYAGKHRLRIDNQDNSYTADLLIELT